MEIALKYSRFSLLVALLVAAVTCSYGQVAASHVKAIPPPVNRNVVNNADANRTDTLHTDASDNSMHEGKAPVALKRVVANKPHPIHIPVMPNNSTGPAGSDPLKKDEDR